MLCGKLLTAIFFQAERLLQTTAFPGGHSGGMTFPRGMADTEYGRGCQWIMFMDIRAMIWNALTRMHFYSTDLLLCPTLTYYEVHTPLTLVSLFSTLTLCTLCIVFVLFEYSHDRNQTSCFNRENWTWGMVRLVIAHLTRERKTNVSWRKQLQSAGKLGLLDLWKRVPWGWISASEKGELLGWCWCSGGIWRSGSSSVAYWSSCCLWNKLLQLRQSSVAEMNLRHIRKQDEIVILSPLAWLPCF